MTDTDFPTLLDLFLQRVVRRELPPEPKPPRKPKKILCCVYDLDGRYLENAWLVETDAGDGEQE